MRRKENTKKSRRQAVENVKQERLQSPAPTPGPLSLLSPLGSRKRKMALKVQLQT